MNKMRSHITAEGIQRRNEKVATHNKKPERRSLTSETSHKLWAATRANGHRQLGNRTAWGYVGFGDAIFLTEAEWFTFRKHKPARHTHKNKTNICAVCGLGSIQGKRFEGAHKIPLMKGMANFGLTPDYLNRDENIVTTHNGKCNAKAELSVIDSMKLMREWGIKELPEYLDEEILELWKTTV